MGSWEAFWALAPAAPYREASLRLAERLAADAASGEQLPCAAALGSAGLKFEEPAQDGKKGCCKLEII